MDYSTLPQYPPHEESSPSQLERLREATGPGWETWVLIATVAALGMALAVLAAIYSTAVGVSGLAG